MVFAADRRELANEGLPLLAALTLFCGLEHLFLVDVHRHLTRRTDARALSNTSFQTATAQRVPTL